MTRRTTVRVIAAACWALALVPAMPGSFGQEASPTLDAVGWWNKSRQLPAEVEQAPSLVPAPLPVTEVTSPPPPSAPEDGLYVANEASGPAAISAVRYLGGGTAGGTLTLTVAGTASGTEPLAACPVIGGFNPEQNGRWEHRPEYDDSTCTVDGVFSEDNATVAFALDSTFVSPLGDLQAVIVPKPGDPTPFQIGFERPSDQSLVPSGPPPSNEMPAFDSGPAFDPGPAQDSFVAPDSSGSFTAPESAPFEAPATDPLDDTAIAETPGPAANDVATTPAATTPDDRAARAFAIGILAAIGAAMWWLANQPERAPRLLGSVGAASREATPAPAPARVASVRPRGVGRFARPRSQPATPI